MIFIPFQKYDFWSDSFSYIRQLYFCSKFLISKYAAMMTWSLTISLSRVRLFWPDLSFGLMTTGRVTNRRPFTEILRTQGKPDLVRKQTFHLNQLFGKFRLKGKAERCTRRSAGKMTGLVFYFHQFRQTIIRHQSNPRRKKNIQRWRQIATSDDKKRGPGTK